MHGNDELTEITIKIESIFQSCLDVVLQAYKFGIQRMNQHPNRLD